MGRRRRWSASSGRPPGADEQPAGTAGERLFARYAYAPNHLGYCGPADSAALAELASTGHTDADVRAIASRFSGAWPYLSVLAELAGIADPLDERVVRAYWTGSSLLDEVDRPRFWRNLLDRIAAAGAERYWTHLKPALIAEAMPTHGFHVFGVYPWTRLLSSSDPWPALHVLDSCRLRVAATAALQRPRPGPARARQLPHPVGAGHLGRGRPCDCQGPPPGLEL